MKQGKLIVIDGIDGAGKTTQTELLLEYFKSCKVAAQHMKFPRYESFYGKTAAKFLRGELGPIESVSPYLASLIYAMDRSAVRDEMNSILNQGTHIITDRYATSNMAHQGSKFADSKERKEFLKWVHELEYEEEKIPKENIVLLLDMPVNHALTLINNQSSKEYLNGKKDIHEESIAHLTETKEEYYELCEANAHWVRIDCVDSKEKLLAPTQIHEKIVGALRQSIDGI